MFFTNAFKVEGRTVLITGGSRGMGLEVGRQLAAKGANVAIVARDQDKLTEGLAYIREGALDPGQRFHQISADVTLSSEAVRVVDEVSTWNDGNPPDVVWCCAGTPHPTLFVDTPVEVFSEVMDSNYFTSLYMAHAILRRWVKDESDDKQSAAPGLARHLIFTSSILAFHTFAGHAAYSPTKVALRSLSDTLSQEVNLYQAAQPHKPRIRLHTIFPSSFLTEGFENEQKIKPDVTKVLEGIDEPLTAQEVAARSIRGLEKGQELITTNFFVGLSKRTMLGGSGRGGFVTGLIDWLISSVVLVVLLVVRLDMDRQVRAFGRKFGSSGNKKDASA